MGKFKKAGAARGGDSGNLCYSHFMRNWREFEALLERLLRNEQVAEKAWDPYRDRAAILITDLSGFTRLTRQLGNPGMMALLLGMRRVAVPILKAHGGIPIKYQADDLFAAFRDPVAALHAALELRRAFRAPDLRLPAEVMLCIGIGYGEVLWWGEEDLYGEEVNLASKLGEDIAGPGEILLTTAAATESISLDGSLPVVPAGSMTVGGTRYEYFRFAGD